MLPKLLIGSCIVALSIVIYATFVALAIKGLRQLGSYLATPPFFIKMLGLLIATTLWMLADHSLSVWLWAAAFRLLGYLMDWNPPSIFPWSHLPRSALATSHWHRTGVFYRA